ncbi:MAG TPA: chloride channel protein [Vicinamibacteria bacterium]|nr:chloride channel protein [Vicinamibacteria bacterium]
MAPDPTSGAPALRALARRRWLTLWTGLQDTLRAVQREEQAFLLLAIFIGLFVGLAVVCLRIAIEWLRITLIGSSLQPPFPRVILVPALTGLAIGLLVRYVFPSARSSGVNQTKSALYIDDGHIPFRSVVGKFVTSALAIGSGHSLGPEDPSLHIGAGVASGVGGRLSFSRDKVRLVAPLGAAAGLAAAFNAPISAVIFVIEEVIGRWSVGVLGPVILSAVSGVVMAHWFLGAEPLFRVPAVELVHPTELIAYAALGLVGGAAAVVFLRLALSMRPRLRALPSWTWPWQPAVAGLVVGLVGLRVPEVMGAGYETIDQAIHGQYVWHVLALLAAAKIVATAVSFASGTPGGLFAPTLFIGAMVGGAVGGLQRLVYPDLSAPIAVYALVGMGTLFAGILRAPMTSVFMVLEVTGNYGIIVPVMVSNTLAYIVSRRFQRTPLFDVLSRQDGLDLPSMEAQREQVVLRVEDAMRPARDPVLAGHQPVSDALARLDASSLRVLVYGSRGWGGVSADRLRRLAAEGEDGMPLADAVEERFPHVHPDHPLEIALPLLHERPLLPVVHRADFGRLVGVISLDDVLRAYRDTGAVARE